MTVIEMLTVRKRTAPEGDGRQREPLQQPEDPNIHDEGSDDEDLERDEN